MRISIRVHIAFGLGYLLLGGRMPAYAQDSAQLFEKLVLPVFASQCYQCHSSTMAAPRSGLSLDTKAGLQRGGVLGSDVVSGKPAESRLIQALSYNDPKLQMPPSGKLPDSVIAGIEKWIEEGAIDPRVDPTADPAGLELFENKIRPVLAASCYSCHSSTLKAPAAGLALDTYSGLRKGGVSGPALVAGSPAESRLLQAIRYGDSGPQMPPSGKLAAPVIADFERWIAMGAPDSRRDVPSSSSPAPLKGMSIADGKKWWSFQPVQKISPPRLKDTAWARTATDAFILSKLEERGLKPSPEASKRTLATRAYIDLLGYRPSYEEVQAFENDKSPDAYAKLIDTLLASPHYGERWARHWMDVARYGEDNPTTEATNPPFPYAWRYRDWIIDALNHDVPYDRFIKLQLAADQMADVKRDDMRALGYLGTAPVYHKDQKLSASVIGTFMTDDWDDRIDAVSRGVLGLSVGCARCHDHKFDPILTKDYYALQGVFASTMRVERPMFDVDPQVETRYLWVQRRLFDLHYAADNLTNEASTVDHSDLKVAKWTAEIQTLKAEMSVLSDRYPQLSQSLEKYYEIQKQGPPAGLVPPGPNNPAAVPGTPRRRRVVTSTEPFMNAVYDAAQYVDDSDKDYTFINYVPGEARDVPVLKGGNVDNKGDIVPRGFPTVLAKSDPRFTKGSGRLELADRIFTDSKALAARVIVNRVWGWHFGRGLVTTPSDFGTQGERPSNPELLNDLAARFIESGWSLKWLHREIMLSAVYRQASRMRTDGKRLDEDNVLLWRMTPKRMDAESYRDSVLRSARLLKEDLYGPSEDTADAVNGRRTIYSRVSRSRPASVFLSQYDFPDPTLTSPGREQTTTSVQQLFVLNSPLIHELAAALAHNTESAEDTPAKIRVLYRSVLSRDPTPAELARGGRFLTTGSVEMYAQSLLETNGDLLAMNPNEISRRKIIESLCGWTGAVGLAGLLGTRNAAAATPSGHYPGPTLPVKAKHVIVLFMQGGPSQLDMFDPKPALLKYQGQRPAAVDLRTERSTGGLLPSPFEFKKHGQSGLEISSLLPQLSTVADDLCVIRSAYTFIPTHTPGVNLFHCGSILATRPSAGAWVNYGLGSANDNIPSFVVLGGGLGAETSGQAGFLPSEFQGSPFNAAARKPEDVIPNLRNKWLDFKSQRAVLDETQADNEEFSQSIGEDAFLDGRIKSLESAFRMQSEAYDLVDLGQEPEYIRAEYGDTPFAKSCLMARRLVEKGVRYVHVNYGGWDDHIDLNNKLIKRCPDMDQAAAALIRDLKRRGKLDETLVVWSGEFGRTPVSESGTGRDHNPFGFTMFMAGGGIRGGLAYGATDEFGFKAVQNRLSIHDIHATMLNRLGMDHTKLTYRYAGREFRLTDVYGEVATDLLV